MPILVRRVPDEDRELFGFAFALFAVLELLPLEMVEAVELFVDLLVQGLRFDLREVPFVVVYVSVEAFREV